MTKDLLIELIKENVIDHNNKEEFKALLTLNNNEALFLKDLKISTELKKEIVFFISHIKKLSEESIKENILNTLMSLNYKYIEDYLKVIDKILKTDITSEFMENIIITIKENNNLITPFLTLINCSCPELFYNGLIYEAFKTLLSFEEAPQDVLNSLSTILINENLIKSKWYSLVAYSFSEYIKNYDIINAMPGSFLFNENILKSKKYQEIFKNTYFHLRDSEQIFMLNKIIDEMSNQKEFANKFLLEIIDILQIIKSEFQTLFLKIAKSKELFSNEFYYIQSLENIKNINSYLYSDLYYDVIMEMIRKKNNTYNKMYSKFFEVLKNIDSYPKFYAVVECMKDSNFEICSYQDFIIESLCKNLNSVHYDYPSLGILLNSATLRNSNYTSLITKLHKINSEHRLELLEIIVNKIFIPAECLTYLFAVDDESLLEEYINYLCNKNIADTQEEWFEIFKISKKIKNAKILEHYTRICEMIIRQFENLERKTELLKLIAEIQDEEIIRYLKNSIERLTILESKYGTNFKSEEKDYRFQNIIGYLSKKDKTLISTFYNIIFNEDFYKLENYLFNINTLDKVTNLESLQIIERIIYTEIGKQIIDKIINIKDTERLKVLELLINELTKSRLSEEVKLEHVESFMNTSNETETIEKNRTLERLLTSSNNLIIKHKEKILKMVLTSNSNSEIREKINKDLLFSRNTKSDILEVLFELSIFPLTYPVEDMLASLTKDELIEMLNKFENEREISGKEEIVKGLGPINTLGRIGFYSNDPN